ncbi:MAG: sugar phosphate isomerase/epimerase family protein [Tepidisphaeraceae bacterium]
MPVPLAFSTNAFTRFSVVHAIESIARAGFAGVEILADEPHVYPLKMDILTRDVAGALSRTNLRVSNVNANCTFGYWADGPAEAFFEPSLISPVKKRRDDRIAMIRRTLRFAKDVGARNISITSGRMTGGMRPERAAEQLHESLKPILDDAEMLGIDVGIELEPGLFLEYVDELVDWIGRIGSTRLGANLDVGHCQVIGESIPASVRALKGRIWNLHIEGMPGRKHYHLIPGDPADTLDWPGLWSALHETAYARFATVELYTMTEDPDHAPRQSFAWLSASVAALRVKR